MIKNNKFRAKVPPPLLVTSVENGNLFVLEVNPEPDITLDRIEFPNAIAEYLWSIQ